MNPGSCDRAAQVAAAELLKRGATNLEAKLAALVASFGVHCWITDLASSKCLLRWDGRLYHRGSIARSRRALARRGVIESRRIFPTKFLPNGVRSSQGTTVKRIDWKRLGVRCPIITRPEKREAKELHKRIEQATTYTPRRRIAIEPELLAMLSSIGAPAPLPSSSTSSPASSRTPAPASSSPSTTPEEAKRRLAAWARDHEKRGPP